MALSTINLKHWIDEHRHLLKPPVGNQLVYQDGELQVMVVGGPNSRKDFHIDPGEELFYQLEGDMVLKVREDSSIRDLPIREGEILLLPPNVPHSPQRFVNTVGLVVERQRRPDETESVLWYCENCDNVLYQHTGVITDLVTQLKPLIEGFYADEGKRTCNVCGTVMQPPAKPKVD